MALHSEIEKREEDPVSISIGEMLTKLSSKSAEPCISRVPNYLRQVNEKEYEPLAISIGPYHHGKIHLKEMEDQKMRFFQKLLEEREENDVSVYVKKIREIENRARKCDAGGVSDLDSDNFVKVLLVDGVFIVQMIRYFSEKCPDYLSDMIKRSSAGFSFALRRDMLLLENQLPFFVISELFHLIDSRSDDQDIFILAIFDMFWHSSTLPGKKRPKEDLKSLRFEKIKHLLDFTYHCCFHPSTSEMEDRKMNRNVNFKLIRCATELKEAGIKFKLVQGRSMFDVRFENETLYIPKITIQDKTESVFRNLIAFEQLFLEDTVVKHATDYMILMDYLINSPKDVEILCRSEIVENLLGDDKALATMINSLGVFVMYSQRRFYYAEEFNKINTHCCRRCNRWMAKLKHKYFSSLWALLSVLAATLLLLLTLLQTVFSVLSYAQ